MRRGCITDYESIYARNYFGHDAGISSFDPAVIAAPLSRLAGQHGGRVLDMGGGNGRLARELEPFDIRTMTVDIAEREAPFYARADLSAYAAGSARELRARVGEVLGDDYLLTCLDVAEHLDIEHLADFVLNMRALLPRRGLVSISHRPSSDWNTYHSTILPLSSWVHILRLVGIGATPFDELNAGRGMARIGGADPSLAAIAHWQRVDPFRSEQPTHQTYLLVEAVSQTPPDEAEVRDRIGRFLDISYRAQKRRDFDASNAPVLHYHLNFVQDWSFLRSLLDVWPASRVRTTLRTDLIAPHLAGSIAAVLKRAAVACTPIDTVQGGFHAMDHWGGVDEALVIGSAEGYVSATHLSASQLLFEARRRGASTLCLQHGMTLPRRLTFAAGSFGAWDEATAATLRAALPPADAARIAVTGSPKLLDALLPGDDAALAARLGAQVGAFARKVLIGTNLHWDAHRHGSQATYAWIERLLARNPDTLFVLRPHPDDSSVYGRPDLLARPNLVLMDDMALLALDWPVARLVRAVDGVITTYSTLALDALAAGRPLAVLPYRHDQARRPEAFFPASLPLNGAADALPVLSDEDWNAGCLPAALTSPRDGTPQEAGREWFEPSRHCLSRITGLGRGAAAHAVEPTRDAMAEAAFEAARFVSFDRHPHQDRANFTAGLTAFLNEGA